MSETAELVRKLQLKPGNSFWVWPENAPAAGLLTEVEDITPRQVEEADVALLFPADRQGVDSIMADHKDALASARAVWIVYAKGNKTDMNRDTLWIQLADYGWKAVSQVAYSDTLSALRIRPFKDGEAPA